MSWDSIPALKEGQTEPYRLRPMRQDDCHWSNRFMNGTALAQW